MPRMLELVRASAVPATLMQSAAKGALSIPPQEMIEILVYLATQNQVFAEQAGLTLAGWDEASLLAAASNPATPKEVLEYLIDARNLRPALLLALLENPAVSKESLARLANSISRDDVDTFLKSKRISGSLEIMQSLAANRNFTGIQSAGIEQRLAVLTAPAELQSPQVQSPQVPSPQVQSPQIQTPEVQTTEVQTPELQTTKVQTANGPEEEADVKSSEQAGVEGESEADAPDHEVTQYLTEHASEIAAEAGKPFNPIGGSLEEVTSSEPPTEKKAKSEPEVEAPQPEFKRPALKKSVLTAEEKRGSALQRIAQLDITGRIQMAMKGTKEERALLVRDGTKIVALAVLESPKISDAEVEKFAGQKNVLEAVLRAIPMKRRFMKQYGVVRNLVSNPRTPIDVSLGLVKRLMVNDLKLLSNNKDVSDTIRKLATKMFRQKLDTSKKSTD
jgi:uncharacterized protein (DUF1778 family)